MSFQRLERWFANQDAKRIKEEIREKEQEIGFLRCQLAEAEAKRMRGK